MPLYDYLCPDCGPFRDWGSMHEHALPASCPDCNRQSRRTISAPFLADMDPHRRIADRTNEKNSHEPKMVRRKEGGGHTHQHGDRHHGHSHGPSRPWMIGH